MLCVHILWRMLLCVDIERCCRWRRWACIYCYQVANNQDTEQQSEQATGDGLVRWVIVLVKAALTIALLLVAHLSSTMKTGLDY